MKNLRFGFGTLLKSLAMAAPLAGLPLLPTLAQSLAVVPNFNFNDVTLIDTSQSPPAVVATIPTTGPSAPCCSSGPEWVALTPGGRYAWVTNLGVGASFAPFDNLVVIDTFNQIPLAVVKAETLPQSASCTTTNAPGCRHPDGIAINPCPALENAVPPCAARNGDTSGSIYAYVTNPATTDPNGRIASVTVIDVHAALTYPSLSPIVSTVLLPAGSKPHHLSVSPDGTTLWVTGLDADMFTPVVWVIDTGKAVTSPGGPGTVTAIHPTAGDTFFGVAAVDATHAWVTVDREPPDPSSVDLLSLMGPPSGFNQFFISPLDIALAPGGTEAWAAVLGAVGCPPTVDSAVLLVRQNPDGSVTAVNQTCTGNGATAVAVKPDDGSLVLAPNNGDGTVSVINTTFQPPAVVATVSVGGPGAAPFGIALQDSLTYNPSTGSSVVPGLPIGLTVTGANASLVGSVKWDLFANGKVVQTTPTLTTSYTYAAAGTFIAKATVLNKSGGTLLTKTVPVVVQSLLQAIRTAEGLTNLALSPSSLRTSLLNDLSGAYVALEVGNRSAAFNDVNLYVNQLTNYVKSLVTPSKTANTALGQGEAIATALKPPPPVLGAGQLAPEGGSSAVGQPVTFTATWTVPNGESWRSLQHVDLRLVANNKGGDHDAKPNNGDGDNSANALPIALWARFDVGDPSTFQLLDDNENVVGSGEPGNAGVLETNTAKLYLADSSFRGSGPTGPSVTVNFAVSFKPAAAKVHGAQPYQSQLLASDVLQGVQGPDQIGHWTVRPVHN